MVQNVFPVAYGPDFDRALENMVSNFFTRLEELLLIPDFKQVQRKSYAIKKQIFDLVPVR